MADVTITAANVKPIGSAVGTALVQAGEAITQGEVVYSDSGDEDKYKLAINTSAAAAAAKGIALTPAADDGWLVVQTAGTIVPGGTLVKGTVYGVSDNAGKLRPVADDGSGDFVTTLGTATDTSTLLLAIQASGVDV